MKAKTYFSTIAFWIFFPPNRILKKLVYTRIWLILVVTKNLKKIHRPPGSGNISARSWKILKKSQSTRSHFTHVRSCSRSLNRVPTGTKRPASIRTYSSWKGDIFPFDRFTGYKKSNQNQFGRFLQFAFALTCYKIYPLFSYLSDFDSSHWRVHLSCGVCRLRARVQLKALSSLLKSCYGLTLHPGRSGNTLELLYFKIVL